MISEAGNSLLLLGILSGIFAALSPKYNKKFAIILATLIGASFALLIYAFWISDFSVLNVYLNSSTLKPNIYKISAAWASHEGSILLFTFILSLVNLVLNSKEHNLATRINSMIISGFLLIIYFTSTPFGYLIDAPLEGMGLTPSLQDPALAIHPPLLYLGYALYILPYSIIMNDLILKKQTDIQLIRTYSSWGLSILTFGIALGSWWAYRELGWGGYWFFDPVENVSLIVLLMAVIFHHMIILAKRDQSYFNIMILSSISVFILSLLGTFLVRSGLLVSVHSFAFDQTRGLAIFILLSAASLFSIWVFGLYRNTYQSSDEAATKNKIFYIAMLFLFLSNIFVIIGTLYPPLYQMIMGKEISIDISYYAMSFAPSALVAVFLVIPALYQNNYSIWIIAFFMFKSINYLIESWILSIALSFGIMLMFWSLLYIRKKRIAVILGHFGLGLFVTSIALNLLMHEKVEFIGKLDDKVNLNHYEIHLHDLKYTKSENYLRQIAKFNIIDMNVNRIISLNPEQRLYMIEKMAKSKPHIYSFLTADLYAVLLNVKDDEIHAEFHYNPAIFTLWFSLFLMIISPLLIRIRRKK